MQTDSASRSSASSSATGTGSLVGVEIVADRPLWAFQDVIGQLEAMGDWVDRLSKAESGDAILNTKVVPTNVLGEGI